MGIEGDAPTLTLSEFIKEAQSETAEDSLATNPKLPKMDDIPARISKCQTREQEMTVRLGKLKEHISSSMNNCQDISKSLTILDNNDLL